jgi:hypothetical protein
VDFMVIICLLVELGSWPPMRVQPPPAITNFAPFSMKWDLGPVLFILSRFGEFGVIPSWLLFISDLCSRVLSREESSVLFFFSLFFFVFRCEVPTFCFYILTVG